MKRTWTVGYVFLFLLSIGFTQWTEAQDLTTRPVPEKGPTVVTVRLAVLNIEQVKGADQTFTADIAFQAEWQDDRLRHSGSEQIRKPLSEVWNPRFQILNRQRVQYTFPEDVMISPEGRVGLLQRAWGQFSEPLVLSDFPFDTQDFSITLVAPGHEEGMVELVEDPERPTRVNDSFTIPDWETLDWTSAISNRPILKGERGLPTFEASISMKRNSQYYFSNVILPLFLIIGMSWIVFWIPSSQMGPRISVSVTAMLTLTAYRFAIGASLPKIAYLTRLDWFILGSSILVFLSLVHVVVTSHLVEKDQELLARRINRSMRVIAPALFLLIGYASLF